LTAWFNVSVYHFYHCHCSSVLPHCVGDDVSFTHAHTERTFPKVYSVFLLYSRVVLPFSLVVVWQLPLFPLQHIHTQTVHVSVGCTPVVRCVLPCCTPVFVGGGLATAASCFATYPHSNCSRVCRLYSRCSLCSPALYSRFRWWWSGNCRSLLCNISTFRLLRLLWVVLPLLIDSLVQCVCVSFLSLPLFLCTPALCW
jgi:hypothetical protein